MLEGILIVLTAIFVIPLIILIIGFVGWLLVYVISEGFVMWAKCLVDVVDYLRRLWK